MMHTEEMLKVFATQRNDAIVIPGRGGRHWTKISDRPNLDVPLGDPAMGGHAGFAFGLAMALPHRKIVLFDSEGDVQMALSLLITIAEQRPANFYHFMLDNECYATTGGQPVPNAKNVAYDLIARGAGYPRDCTYDRLEDFAGNIEPYDHRHRHLDAGHAAAREDVVVVQRRGLHRHDHIPFAG